VLVLSFAVAVPAQAAVAPLTGHLQCLNSGPDVMEGKDRVYVNSFGFAPNDCDLSNVTNSGSEPLAGIAVVLRAKLGHATNCTRVASDSGVAPTWMRLSISRQRPSPPGDVVHSAVVGIAHASVDTVSDPGNVIVAVTSVPLPPRIREFLGNVVTVSYVVQMSLVACLAEHIWALRLVNESISL
jgi:hypothetical protein